VGLVKLGSLAEAKVYAHVASSTISMTDSSNWAFTGWHRVSTLASRVFLVESERAVPQVWPGGLRE